MFDWMGEKNKTKKTKQKRVKFEWNDARYDLGLSGFPGGSNGVCRDGREVCWIVPALLPTHLHFMLHVELTTFPFFPFSFFLSFFFLPSASSRMMWKAYSLGLLCRRALGFHFTDGSFNSNEQLPSVCQSTLRRMQDVPFIPSVCPFSLQGKRKKRKKKEKKKKKENLGGLVQCAIKNPQYAAK